MDLTQIEQWTRQALEAEAIRRGIRDPHLRTTRELIRAILRQEFGAPIARSRQRMAKGLRFLDQARGFFDAATVVAAALWPAQLRSKVGSLPPEPAALGDTVKGGGCAPPVHDVCGLPVEPPPAVVVETLSMARTLAAQGQRERALEIYGALIARNALDPVPRAEAAALRAGEAPVWAERIKRLRTPVAAESVPAADGDRIECQRNAAGGYSVSWRVTVAGEERARALLGEAGERALRWVTIGPDAETLVRSEVRERAPIEAEGELELGPSPPAARCHVVVGLRGARRFVPITHTSPLQDGRGEPAEAQAPA